VQKPSWNARNARSCLGATSCKPRPAGPAAAIPAYTKLSPVPALLAYAVSAPAWRWRGSIIRPDAQRPAGGHSRGLSPLQPLPLGLPGIRCREILTRTPRPPGAARAIRAGSESGRVMAGIRATRNVPLTVIPYKEKHNLPSLVGDYQNHPSEVRFPDNSSRKPPPRPFLGNHSRFSVIKVLATRGKFL